MIFMEKLCVYFKLFRLLVRQFLEHTFHVS